MGVMATRRTSPQTAVVWEQLRSYGTFTGTMVIVGLVGALGLLVNHRIQAISFRDVVTVYDYYRALAFIGMALLLAVSHNPENARMAFPLRLFRLPLPTETLAALVLGSRMLLLCVVWAFLLLFRIVLMEAPDRLGIELFYLCLGLAWYTGFQAGTWFAAGRNVWLWGAWVVPLGTVATVIALSRTIQRGYFDAPELCGAVIAVLGILALQSIRAVRFHRGRSLDEEKVGFRDVLRRQHRWGGGNTLSFDNPLDAQAWFLRRRYHQGRKWVFALAALAVVACKLYTYADYANPVILLLLLLFPVGCVFLLALYWQVADAYLGRSGGMTFMLVRPFSSTDFARARLIVASRQVLWDLCLVAGLPLLAMWVVPPWPTLLHSYAWPVALAGFHEQFGLSALRAALLAVFALWALRAMPPDTAAKGIVAVFTPLIVMVLLQTYNLVRMEDRDTLVVLSLAVGAGLTVLFLRALWSASRFRLVHRGVVMLSVAAWVALAVFYFTDAAEFLSVRHAADTSGLRTVVGGRQEPVLYGKVLGRLAWPGHALLMAGLGGLVLLPFAAGPLQWRRWRHGAGKDAAVSASPAGGDGTESFLRRFLPAPLGLAGVLGAVWLAGAWYDARIGDYLPRVSGERRSLESLQAEAARVPAADNASLRYQEIVTGLHKDLAAFTASNGALPGHRPPSPPGTVYSVDSLINDANRLLCGTDCDETAEPGLAGQVDAAMRALGPRLDELVEASALPKATGRWARVSDSYSNYQHFNVSPESWAGSLLSIEGQLACDRGDLPRALRMLEGLLNLAAQNPENYAWGQADLRAGFFISAGRVLTCLLAGNQLDTATLQRLDAAWERAFASPHRAGRAFRSLYEARAFNLPFDMHFRGFYGFDRSELETRMPDLPERCVAPWYCLSGMAARQRWIAAQLTEWWVGHTQDPEQWQSLDHELGRLWRALGFSEREGYDGLYRYSRAGSPYFQMARDVTLARTAIKLRLFHQQWGRLPDTLAGLLPEARPPDFRVQNKTYCGGMLRYVRVGDGCVLEFPTGREGYSDEYRYLWVRSRGRLILQPEPWQAARQ